MIGEFFAANPTMVHKSLKGMQDYIWIHGKKNVFKGMIKTFLMIKDEKKEYLKLLESI